MTNKERYKRTFSTLHASGKRLVTEETSMRKNKKSTFVRLAPAFAALVLAVVISTGAYASDAGHIQRKLQIWIRGDQTDAVLETGDGHYSLTYEDETGEAHEIQGGGVAIEADGRERPLTEEELMEHLDAPDVEYREDGSVWIYYHGQSLDISDRFEDGVCFVKLVDPEKTLYVTVKYQNGFAYSQRSYCQPWTFN